jgi:hypothetical protein
MNYSRLLFTIFSIIGGILVFAVWSNIQAYAQPSSSPPSTAGSPSTMISPEIKAKMCDPSNPDLSCQSLGFMLNIPNCRPTTSKL